jgi:hypothetical protein
MQPVIRLLVVSDTLIYSIWSSFLFINSLIVKMLNVKTEKSYRAQKGVAAAKGDIRPLKKPEGYKNINIMPQYIDRKLQRIPIIVLELNSYPFFCYNICEALLDTSLLVVHLHPHLHLS